MILINSIALGGSSDAEEDEFIKYLEDNRGYELDYDFEDIKNAVRGLEYENKILSLNDLKELLKNG